MNEATITNEQARIIGEAIGEAIWRGFVESVAFENRSNPYPVGPLVERFGAAIGRELKLAVKEEKSDV